MLHSWLTVSGIGLELLLLVSICPWNFLLYQLSLWNEKVLQSELCGLILNGNIPQPSLLQTVGGNSCKQLQKFIWIVSRLQLYKQCQIESVPNADRCQSMSIKILALILNSSQCCNFDCYWSALIRIGHDPVSAVYSCRDMTQCYCVWHSNRKYSYRLTLDWAIQETNFLVSLFFIVTISTPPSD